MPVSMQDCPLSIPGGNSPLGAFLLTGGGGLCICPVSPRWNHRSLNFNGEMADKELGFGLQHEHIRLKTGNKRRQRRDVGVSRTNYAGSLYF
jgi:hypothetical protein